MCLSRCHVTFRLKIAQRSFVRLKLVGIENKNVSIDVIRRWRIRMIHVYEVMRSMEVWHDDIFLVTGYMHVVTEHADSIELAAAEFFN